MSDQQAVDLLVGALLVFAAVVFWLVGRHP